MAETPKPKKFVVVFLEEKLRERPRHKPAKKTAKQAKASSGDQFMRKALEAQQAGRLSALEISIAEDRISRAMPVPKEIEDRVYG